MPRITFAYEATNEQIDAFATELHYSEIVGDEPNPASKIDYCNEKAREHMALFLSQLLDRQIAEQKELEKLEAIQANRQAMAAAIEVVVE